MHKRAWAILTIASLIVAMMPFRVAYSWENSALQAERSDLQQQIRDLNSQLANLKSGVNLTLVDLEINDLDYLNPVGVPALYINGNMKNSCGGSISGVELQVTAQDNGSVLMNMTVPYDDFSAYEYNVDQKQHNILAAGMYSWTDLSYVGGTLKSTTHGPRIDYLNPGDNRTIVGGFEIDHFNLRIYHQNLFPNSTNYKVTPIWEAAS